MKGSHWLLTVGAIVVGVGPASPVHAEVRCGSLPVRWNAPEGAAVVTRHEGVVASIFDSAGRYWTHVMLSHGAQELSHAHRATPRRTDTLNQLLDLVFDPESMRAGMPGPSRVNTAAAFAAQWGYDNASVYPGTERAVEVARFLDGLGMEEQFEPSGAALNFSRYLIPDATGTATKRPYSFLQFKEIGTNHLGIPSADGMACSTFLAWAANRALGATIPLEVFDTETVLRGLREAKLTTRDICLTELSGAEGFEAEVAAAFGVLTGACDRAGSQIANCLSGVDGYSCASRLDHWNDPSNWFNGTAASTLSPDQLINWRLSGASNPSPWNPLRAGPAAFPFSLEWSNDGEEIFGCWVASPDGPDGRITELPEAALNAPSCENIENVLLSVPTVRAYYDPSNGADSDIDGNHPQIAAALALQVSPVGDVRARATLAITEAGDSSATTYRHTGSSGPGSTLDLPLPVRVPAGCRVTRLESHVGTLSGRLDVSNAGSDNHAETLYARDNTSGVINTARCVSDNNGGLFGGAEENLYCDFELFPVTIHMERI